MVSEKLKRVLRSTGCKGIVLYGSVPEALAGYESDIDVLVVVDTDDERENAEAAMRHVKDNSSVKLDISYMTSQEVRERAENNDYLLASMAETGVILEDVSGVLRESSERVFKVENREAAYKHNILESANLLDAATLYFEMFKSESRSITYREKDAESLLELVLSDNYTVPQEIPERLWRLLFAAAKDADYALSYLYNARSVAEGRVLPLSEIQEDVLFSKLLKCTKDIEKRRAFRPRKVKDNIETVRKMYYADLLH